MVRRLLAGVFCLGLFACSGGGDATGPDPLPHEDPPPPAHEPGPGKPEPVPTPGPEQPPPPPAPGPEQTPPPPPPPPVFSVAGDYGLTQINQSQPGQLVLLSNPDGSAIGLYRFDPSSVLSMNDQAWAFVVLLEDEKNVYQIRNQGTYTRSGDQGEDFTFVSTIDGKVFTGHATDGSMVFTYDLDGDSQPDTKLGFILKG
jgi:hypothetical protein